MRILNFILATAFLVFAFLQVNHPNAVLWILTYGAMAVFCILAIFEFYPRKFLFVSLVAVAGFSVVFVPGVMQWLQEGDTAPPREFLALMFCHTVLAIHLLKSRKVR